MTNYVVLTAFTLYPALKETGLDNQMMLPRSAQIPMSVTGSKINVVGSALRHHALDLVPAPDVLALLLCHSDHAASAPTASTM